MNTLLQVQKSETFCCLRTNLPLQGINIQNMNVELVAQMFKNYQSNVLFHLEGMFFVIDPVEVQSLILP